MFNKSILLLLLIWVGFPDALWGSPQIRARVEEMLMERHPVDNPKPWLNLGKEAPLTIIEMFQEPDRSTYQKTRLLGALSYFDHPEAIDFIKQNSKNENSSVLKRTAIRALGASPLGGKKEENLLFSFLEDSDPQIQMTALETLKKINDPEITQKLNEKIKSGKLSSQTEERATPGLKRSKLSPLVAVSSNQPKLTLRHQGEWKGFLLQSGKEIKVERIWIRVNGDQGVVGALGEQPKTWVNIENIEIKSPLEFSGLWKDLGRFEAKFSEQNTNPLLLTWTSEAKSSVTKKVSLLQKLPH